MGVETCTGLNKDCCIDVRMYVLLLNEQYMLRAGPFDTHTIQEEKKTCSLFHVTRVYAG